MRVVFIVRTLADHPSASGVPATAHTTLDGALGRVHGAVMPLGTGYDERVPVYPEVARFAPREGAVVVIECLTVEEP